MALTGIQIFKMLPKTNCGECEFSDLPCLCHGTGRRKGRARKVPDCFGTGQGAVSEAGAPPIRPLTIGIGDNAVKIGGETVMFRHEKTFFNNPGIAVLITERWTMTRWTGG